MENYIFKETKEQFLNSGPYFRQVIENFDGVPFQLIFGAHIGEGFYHNLGSGIKQLLGVDREDFTEKLYNSMIEKIVPVSENIPCDHVILRQKFKNGEIKNLKTDVLIRTLSGEKKWIRESSVPMTDEKTGKVIGSFGILFDIASQKTVDMQSGNVQNKKEDNDILKDAFLHNISHEIRTPLNAIIGFSSLLSEQEYGPERRQEFLDAITRSSDHLLEIINDIVEISKIEAGSVKIFPEEVYPDTIVQRIYDKFISNANEKEIRLQISVPFNGKSCSFITDDSKLYYVLSNLVSNALKFTSKGKVEFGYEFRVEQIEFYVYDTGIGIPPEYHSKIFDRFYQVDSSNTRSYGGTGLGLTISKAYIEMLGGRIWLSSQPGKGTVFFFTLPLHC
ncbi:MAG TPA: HAMP domain-containing sensor histidine kinase [Bacteroidales bacterium]|nr:HAMP domain-containing sensor histidine kinase [Bacteroidales bacterium]HPT20961.1 HAMP domain-containing sensor histidine kinase [Bacteroidales bacterium]